MALVPEPRVAGRVAIRDETKPVIGIDEDSQAFDLRRADRSGCIASLAGRSNC